MLKTWLVFFGLTMVWIVTRSVCLETWNQEVTSPIPATGQAMEESCQTCQRLYEKEKNLAARQDMEALSLLQPQIQSCRGRCDRNHSLNNQENLNSITAKYRP